MTRALVLIVFLAVGTLGCSNDTQQSTTSPTSPNTEVFFTGILNPKGSSFYTFSVTQAGTVTATVASLSTSTFNPTPGLVVGLGFGTPVGTGCQMTTSLQTSAGLASQLSAASGPGTVCINIFDVGRVAASTTFVVRIDYP
jgi:hypothetical protein